MCALSLAALQACLGVHAVHAEEKEDDPTISPSRNVQLENGDQPVDMTAPPSQVAIHEGDEMWQNARARLVHPVGEHNGGYFDATQLIGDDFRSAKNFHAERYVDTDTGSILQMIVAADEATKEGDKIIMNRMRMIYFIPETPPPAPKKDAKKGTSKPAPPADPMAAMFYGGRMVVTAPKSVIDSTTNEGRATGTVTIEIFAPDKPGAPKEPIAKLSSEKLRWRTWNEASNGSTELALYTSSEDLSEPDPLVTGTYILPQPDGTPSSIYIKGKGMIFEIGSYDRLTAVNDESDRPAGLSMKERNRALFHSGITMESTASTMGSLFQMQAAQETAAISRTIITCNGPALLDMCVVPLNKGNPNEKLKEIEVQRRFEFYNKVHLTKRTEDEKPVPGAPPSTPTEMACGQLWLEYPPGVMPGPATLPQIAEAVGGVVMSGTSVGAATPAGNQATSMPPGPFSIDCDRIYHDGQKDNMFLVGTSLKPAHVKNSDGEAEAQQLNFRKKTQAFIMPAVGPKKLVMHSAPPVAPAAGVATGAPVPPVPSGTVIASGGDTIIKWNGLLTREIKHLPVPQAPDRIKEVMTFNKDVVITQPDAGMNMVGQIIRVIRDEQQQVEYLEGTGDSSIKMGSGEHAKGELICVTTQPGDPVKNIPNTNLIAVTGDRSRQIKATLHKPGSAVCADKFIIDERADTFRAFGGAVAVFKGPPKTDADPKAPVVDDSKAIFKSIKFEQGGDLAIQCDGEFSKDGATHRVTLKKNVIVRQPGLQLFADEVYLTLDDPPSPAAAPAVPASGVAPAADVKPPVVADGKTPGANPADAPPPPSGLFSGDLKCMECFGTVELVNENQWVQCDHLFYDAPTEKSSLQVSDPDNDVRIYLRQEDGGTKILSVKSSLEVDGKAGVYNPGGLMFMLPYKGKAPTGREKINSPAHFDLPPTVSK